MIDEAIDYDIARVGELNAELWADLEEFGRRRRHWREREAAAARPVVEEAPEPAEPKRPTTPSGRGGMGW